MTAQTRSLSLADVRDLRPCLHPIAIVRVAKLKYGLSPLKQHYRIGGEKEKSEAV